ncbi:unnamed protein product, partial [Ixodes hexagonus]
MKTRPSKANIPQRPISIPALPEDKSGSSMKSKGRVFQNLLVVSMGFLLLFTAYQSIQNLQSSINPIAGMGTASLATIYMALVLSCMFVPTYMIRRLGLKYTMVSSVTMYIFYFMANMHPTWLTLLPASMILGVGGASLWTSKCAYLSYLAQEYADLVGAEDSAPFVANFFGVFFMIFQSTQIWGNLISYVVLQPPNMTEPTSLIEHCGSTFHPSEDLLDAHQTNLGSVSSAQTYTLSGLYTCCVLAAILMLLVFLDPVRQEVFDPNPPMTLLVETVNQMRRGYQQLIIPLTVYSGMQQAFFWGDFTQAYISCAWGVQNVGFVMISYGTVDALCSAIFGFLVKSIGRVPIILLAAILNTFLMVFVLTWHPNPAESHIFFLVAAFWGMADASWQTQINGEYFILNA